MNLLDMQNLVLKVWYFFENSRFRNWPGFELKGIFFRALSVTIRASLISRNTNLEMLS